jgi:hypothetical protein
VPVAWILFVFESESGGFEADGSDECIQIVDDTLVEAVELRSTLGFEARIWLDGFPRPALARDCSTAARQCRLVGGHELR